MITASALLVFGTSVVPAPAQTNKFNKSSRLADGAAGKSDFARPGLSKSDLAVSSPRGDLLDGRRSAQTAFPGLNKANADVAAGAIGKVDLLELLLPSDPHVEDDTQQDETSPAVKPKSEAATKRQAPAGKRRPIGIAHTKGRIVLNRFHTMKLSMEHRECREFPGIVMADYQLPATAIETLADNMSIVQKQMCASNGLVVFTCYQNEATISLRRARPDDGCKR